MSRGYSLPMEGITKEIVREERGEGKGVWEKSKRKDSLWVFLQNPGYSTAVVRFAFNIVQF